MLRLRRPLSDWGLIRRLTAHFAVKGAGERRAIALLQQSTLFDGEWYLRTYPDVAASGQDPAQHYLNFGWREGRDPGPHFSTDAYLRANVDVTRAGTNPLIHFIEFGYSEGRGRTKHRVPARRGPSPGEPFGEPAPCLSLVPSEDVPRRWRRAFRLVANPDLFMFDGMPIGYAVTAAQREEIEAAFARLGQLSGDNSRILDQRSEEPAEKLSLADAWHVDQGRLRTRWFSSELPIVVRAYQRNPHRNDRLAMVGEGLVSSSADFVDVALCNRYFPLLFVIAEPNGKIRASRLLGFPSLCRGGLHYAELLALSELEQCDKLRALDPIGLGRALGDRLLAVRAGTCSRFVADLVVDLMGADGAQPIFQPDFLHWCTQVAQIEVRVNEPESQGAATRYLASAVRTAARCLKANGGASLVLAPDMIPTISTLTALSGDDGEPLNAGMSLLVAGSNPSQPAHLFCMPCSSVNAMQATVVGNYPRAWPFLVAGEKGGSSTPLAASAIRLTAGDELTDSELLMPTSGSALPVTYTGQPIAWLIWPEIWDQDLLSESLHSLSLQDEADSHQIMLVASGEPAILPLARDLFARVQVSNTLEDGLAEIKAPLVGFVGSGIVLHDRRCSGFLSNLLENLEVATASCIVVQSEPRGKSIHVTIADAGTDVDGLPVEPRDAKRMWRSVFPVANPPHRFWMARAELLRSSLNAHSVTLPAGSLNLCTSLVTVSTVVQGQNEEFCVAPPASPEFYAIRSKTLFG